MSTIDGYWLPFGTHTAGRGRCARFLVFQQPPGGALEQEVVQTHGLRICLVRSLRLLLRMRHAECVLRDSMRAERSAFYFSFRLWFTVFAQLNCRRQS